MSARSDAVAERIFAFERNTVVRASAGTGKTEALTGLYVHLVLGATERARRLHPDHVVAMTFTEKATEEMRTRVESALSAVAHGAWTEASVLAKGGDAALPRAARVALHGLAVRGRLAGAEADLRAHAVRALHALPRAPIQTIHGFAAALVKAHAVELGLPPSLDVVHPREAGAWLEESVALALEEALRGGDAALGAMVLEANTLFGGQDLVGSCIAALAAIREGGGSPTDPALLTGYRADPREVRAEALAALGLPPDGELAAAREVIASLALRRVASDTGRKPPTREAALAAIDVFRGPRTVSAGDDELVAEVTRLREALETYLAGTSKVCTEDAPASLAALREALAAVDRVWSYPRSAARAGSVARLLGRALVIYTDRKREAGVLDFTDQLLLARDLLRDRPALRDQVTRRVGALLVDEFQDTNGIQRDLVYLLRAKEGLPAGVPDRASLQPAGLFVVGDPKQSIYGFRNADVAVFEAVTRDVQALGGVSLALQTSFRATAPLASALNTLSRTVLGTGEGTNPSAVTFTPEDELLCDTPPADDAPSVTVLEVTKDDARTEPELVAAWIKRAVVTGSPAVRDPDTKLPRPVRYGDCALLLRTFTRVLDFTRALTAEGVPYAVVNGRGLFEASEVRDFMALLDVLSGRDTGLGLVTVLRSPLFLVSDQDLLLTRQRLPGRDWSALFTPAFAEGALSELPAVALAVGRLAEARAAAHRVGLGAAAARVLADQDYLEVLSLLPNGLSRMRNVEALLAELRAHERAGEDGRHWLDDLHARADRADDAESDGVLGGADVVRIMTVHQSKGLQFGVVIAAGLGSGPRDRDGVVRFDRDPGLGLGVSPGRLAGAKVSEAHLDRVKERSQARSVAEAERIFYVQVTRARDHLVLAGATGRGAAGPLKAVSAALTEHVASAEQAAFAVDRTLPPPTEAAVAVTAARSVPALDAKVLSARVFPAQLPKLSLEVSVSELEDHVLCPRRHRAKHVLRFPENPTREVRVPGVGYDGAADGGDAGPSDHADDARLRGTRVHAVLEQLDFSLAERDRDAALERALRQAALPASDGPVRERVLGLLESCYAAALGREGPARVKREVPFAIGFEREGGSVLLRGRMDLLVLAEDRVEVVDYKVTVPSSPEAAEGYAFQLACYRHAAREAVKTSGAADAPVRAGVWFADGTPREPVFLPDAALDAERVDVAVDALLRNARTESTEGRARAYCDSIRCGYRWLCHPS